jgi:Flp pilus assembly pilin Flp
MLGRFWNDDRGQGLGEYTLIVALVSVGLMAIISLFRTEMGDIFRLVIDVLDGSPSDQFVG